MKEGKSWSWNWNWLTCMDTKRVHGKFIQASVLHAYKFKFYQAYMSLKESKKRILINLLINY